MLLLCASARAQQGDAAATPAVVLPAPSPHAGSPTPASASTSASTPVPSALGASKATSAAPSANSGAGPAVREEESLLIEGEKRFATNCGRCHQSPHHFPPRMMATVVRHMRVRATITDDDMRLILRYLTQ